MSSAGNSSPEPQKRLEIRKYPNRRYYDATRSCHVTLEQIHGLIREGHEVRIIDSKTEQDITPQILAQIIIEMDAPKLGVFPVAMLHRILQSNQGIVQEFVHKYFNEPLSAFLDSQGNMERYVRRAFGIQPSAPTTADWAKMMWGPLNPAFWSSRGAASDAAAPKAPVFMALRGLAGSSGPPGIASRPPFAARR